MTLLLDSGELSDPIQITSVCEKSENQVLTMFEQAMDTDSDELLVSIWDYGWHEGIMTGAIAGYIMTQSLGLFPLSSLLTEGEGQCGVLLFHWQSFFFFFFNCNNFNGKTMTHRMGRNKVAFMVNIQKL